MRLRNIRSLVPLVVLLGAGCATGPEEDPTLDDARDAYTRIENDPQVLTHAPLALMQAEESLQVAAQAEDEDERRHLAYIAEQRARIARQEAEFARVRERIANAESAQKEVLLEARAQELEQAEARASQLALQIEELRARETARGLVLTLSDVLFATGRAELQPGALPTVHRLTDFLQAYPERQIRIEGFTDSTGEAAFNQALSQRRADAVRNALVDRGIDPQRIETRGYGELYPVASNATAEGRQLNRRVEIVISDDEGYVPERSG